MFRFKKAEVVKDEEEVSPRKKKKVVNPLKRKKKKRTDSADDDESYVEQSSANKSVRIKKFGMKLKSRKKKENGEEDSYSSKASKSRGRSPAPPPTIDGQLAANRQQGYGGDGGFQLDMVSPGQVPGGAPRPNAGRRVKAEEGDDNKKFRVKPFHAFPSPYYLNENGLYECMMAPSENVEFLNSFLNPSTKATRRAKVPEVVRRTWGTPKDDGRIGSLKVEVLGCVGLARAKPEVAVYLVVGDCAFSTDIIQAARSPMWPNSSKRSAVFPLHHAYARLFVGVFDVKQRKSSEADFFCGRVAIDIPPLRPDTEYDVTFPLRSSGFIYDRRPRGVVRLRFSLHWFSERAAILSYMKRPRNPLAFSKQAKKQPTIPCGDPKTFRNVAVTVHGQDFPGKYTRGAFRATMREFNLYQQNLRFLFKVIILDCVLYENPFMSLFLFGASMHCVWLNSVRLVPPYFVGWIIYLLVDNYMTYNASLPGHLGYKPVTILEVAKGLIRDGRDKKFNFAPLLAHKRARKHGNSSSNNEMDRDIELMNHREFPFSERFEYHKFSAAEAIAPSPASKSKKGGKGTDLRTARRLSIYVAPIEQKEEESENEEDSVEDSDQGDKDEEASMLDQGDDGYGDMDSDAEEEDDEEGGAGGKARMFETGKASATRRIRVGPPQNSDTSGRKVPPQVHLSRVEHMLHKATKNISVEHVHFPPPHIQMQLGKEENTKAPASDVISAKERQNFDEFDRLLGFRVRNPNPILRITSSFLGPLMRIIRIVIYAVRISFNVTTWRDPFLTFWLFAFLCTLAFVLLIFPWRTFLFLASFILLGPQNMVVRKYLERKAKEKELDEKEAAKEKDRTSSQTASLASHQQEFAAQKQAALLASDDASTTKSKAKRKWGRGRKSATAEAEDETLSEVDTYHSPRPAFYAHTRPTRRTQVPRDVAVPYFRFRKDRFFDWPPDPTVSRATPIMPYGGAAVVQDDMDESVHKNSVDIGSEASERSGAVRQRPRRQKNAEPEEIDYGYG